jgi:hypothetical protein
MDDSSAMMSENDENNEYARACRGTREEIEGEISDMGDSPVDASTMLTSRRRRSVVHRRKCSERSLPQSRSSATGAAK